MSSGQLRCLGSSLFLKKTYGVGYQLTIEKNPRKYKPGQKGNADNEMVTENGQSGTNNKSLNGAYSFEDEDVIDDRLKGIVFGAVSKASLLSNVGTEMTFQLPLGASASFTSMFNQLDKETDEGGIVTYGVGITTLDEVFLLVARGEDKSKKEYASSGNIGAGPRVPLDMEKSERSRMDLENEGLFVRHLGALFTKRAVNFKRDKKAWLCTTILPSLFVLLGLLLFKYASPQRDLGPVTLSLNDFNEGVNVNPRNPIPFNDASSPYTCQPGLCMYDPPVVQNKMTNEKYYFCGAQANLANLSQVYMGDTPLCSVHDTDKTTSRITEAGAEAIGLSSITNVNQVRKMHCLNCCMSA